MTRGHASWQISNCIPLLHPPWAPHAQCWLFPAAMWGIWRRYRKRSTPYSFKTCNIENKGPGGMMGRSLWETPLLDEDIKHWREGGNDGKVIAGTSLSSNIQHWTKGAGGNDGKFHAGTSPRGCACYIHVTCTSRNIELLQISFSLPTTYDLRENMYLYQVFFYGGWGFIIPCNAVTASEEEKN